MTWLPDFLTWENATTFFNSAFVISLIGALAGAYAGATAAQRIAERTKERDQLLTQIRSTNAAIMVALAGAPAAELRGALWWMMGSASDATWGDVGRLALAVLVFGGALMWLAREIDVLALGEEPAAALGANVDRTSRQIFLLASFLAAATVAAAGLVGFVGLVVPNIARALGARRHRPMLIVSAVYGAALLVFADLVARTARAPQELPLGAITALIGVPFFLARLRKLN